MCLDSAVWVSIWTAPEEQGRCPEQQRASLKQAAFLFSSVGSQCKATWGPEEIALYLSLVCSLLIWPGPSMPVQFANANSLYHFVLLPPFSNLLLIPPHQANIYVLLSLPKMIGRCRYPQALRTILSQPDCPAPAQDVDEKGHVTCSSSPASLNCH